MSFLSEKKAREIFELYKKAELEGQDDKAKSLEAQLNEAGWEITHGPEGWTIVKQDGGGLFSGWGTSSTDMNLLIPRNTPASPYSGTENTNSKTGLYILIGLGTLVLIIGVVLAVRAYKKGKNGAVKIQTRT